MGRRVGEGAYRGLELSVEDSGSGLAEGAQTRVFERFYRAEPGTRWASSGLGLAIVRTLVERHGGHMEAHNPPEGGAALHVTLPQASPDARALPEVG